MSPPTDTTVSVLHTRAVSQTTGSASPRRSELLERAYEYVLRRGLADVSLRPLAAEIGSSPRVLLFLFGSKDGLVRALLARAREDELQALQRIGEARGDAALADVGAAVWDWLASDEHRALLTLWTEAYARSLVEPHGAWADFASRTVVDWLAVLATAQTPRARRTRAGIAERTLLLAILRGALLDLLATGDHRRVDAAVRGHLDTLRTGP
jgi:AcrR family transcriptional regulator